MASIKYILLFMLCGYAAQAQTEILYGRVLSAADSGAIPYVNIVTQQYRNGTATDMEGGFALPIHQHDTILFSVLGYARYKLPVDAIEASDNFTVFLQPEAVELLQVDVVYKSAADRLLDAIHKLQKELPQNPYNYNLFYRQYHKEDGRYVRLIEADMTIADQLSGVQHERITVNDMCRSDVYELNGDVHGDHIVDMLLENMAFYPRGTILDANALPYFNVQYLYHNNPDEILLSYSYSSPMERKNYSGQVLLDNWTNAIISIDEKTEPNPMYRGEGYGRTVRWDFLKGEKHLSFQRINGHVYLDSLVFRYEHNVIDQFSGRVEHRVTEAFNLYVLGIDTGGDVPEDGSRHGDLYLKRYPYTPEFWLTYEGLKQHPLPEAVQHDLERWTTLSEQFKDNARHGSGS